MLSTYWLEADEGGNAGWGQEKRRPLSGKKRINTTHYPGHVVVGLCQEWAREQRGLLNSSGLGCSPMPQPLLVSLCASPWQSTGTFSRNLELWAGQEVNLATSPFWKVFSKTLFCKSCKHWTAENEIKKTLGAGPALPVTGSLMACRVVVWRVMGRVSNPQRCPSFVVTPKIPPGLSSSVNRDSYFGGQSGSVYANWQCPYSLSW